MTLTVVQASTLDPEARAAFTKRVAAVGSTLRHGPTASFAPGPEYTRVVLALAATRASELLAVLRGESVIARGLVAVHPVETSTATLGLFEVAPTDDALRATVLLAEAARAWAAARACTRLLAPVDLNSWFSYRLLVPPSGTSAGDGPYDWEPVTPPEHRTLLTGAGFAPSASYHSLVTTPDGEALARGLALSAPAVAKAHAAGMTITPFDATPLDTLLDDLFTLSDAAFRGNSLFEPLPRALFRAHYERLAERVDFAPSQVARDAAGRLMGYLFAFVDGGTAVVKTAAVSTDARNCGLMKAMHFRSITELARRPLTAIAWAPYMEGNWSGLLARDFASGPAALRQRDYELLALACTPATPTRLP